jgi:hypothetical protein
MKVCLFENSFFKSSIRQLILIARKGNLVINHDDKDAPILHKLWFVISVSVAKQLEAVKS